MPATGSSASEMKNPEHLLMVADSEHDANMLYAVGMFVPDPFIFLRSRGRNYMVMSDLEIDRARKQAPHCRVLSLSRYQRKLRAKASSGPALPRSFRPCCASGAFGASWCRRISLTASPPTCSAAASG